MAMPDWLSIEEISRLWGEETESDSSAFKQDLEEWHFAFIRHSASSQSLITGRNTAGRNTDCAKRTNGMVGLRYLDRPTFEHYCEERGHPKPRFWFGGEVREIEPEKIGQPEPVTFPAESESLQDSGERSGVNQDSNADVEFQVQVAEMSDKLRTLWGDSADDGGQATSGRAEVEADIRPTSSPAKPSQEKPIERAEAAIAKDSRLKTRLRPAVERTADLAENSDASPRMPKERPVPPCPASPQSSSQEPSTSVRFLQRSSKIYRDPEASRQMLRKIATPKNKKKPVRVIPAVGLAVLLAALLFWGVETVLRRAGDEQVASSTESAGPAGGLGAVDDGRPPADVLPLEPTSGRLGLVATVPQDDEQFPATTEQEAPRPDGAEDARGAVNAGQETQITRQTSPADFNAASGARQPEQMLVTTVSSAQVVALQRELETARRRIADLSKASKSAEAEAAKLREELSARIREVPAQQLEPEPAAAAMSEPNPVVDDADPEQVPSAEVSAIAVATETGALSNPVLLGSVLGQPGQYVGREVVVTGPVMWLARRYWLRSDDGQRSMLIDVVGLPSDDRDKLRNAVSQAEFLTQIRARIRGTVKREKTENYYLAAIDLVLVE